MFEEAPIDLKEAAEILDMTPAGVRAIIVAEKIPAEKVGKKIFVEKAIIEAIPSLMEEFGRKWHEHAPWNGGAGVKASSKIVGSYSDRMPSLEARLLQLAKEAHKAGDLDVAIKLQQIILERYDFT